MAMNLSDRISIDFETYSEVDIKKAGAFRYAEDESTEVLMLSYGIPGEEPELWLPHMPFPSVLEEAVKLHAWNATFEIEIWNQVCTRLYGWPEVSHKKFIDTMAVAASFGFPLALDNAAKMVDGQHKKDPKGTRLMNKFSKPRKPTKKNPSTRVLPEDDLEAFGEFCEYCRQDVRTESGVLLSLPRQELSEYEQKVWELNYEMQKRGVRVDSRTINHIQKLIAENNKKLEEKCKTIAGGITSTQLKEVLKVIKSTGYEMPDMTAPSVKEALKDPSLPQVARDLLEIRVETGKTSLKKYPTIQASTCSDGRIRGMLVYHGASTGRFAGRLVQLHNLPRGNYKMREKITNSIASLGLDEVELLYDSPSEFFSSAIRQMLVPSEGKEFYTADYANIEGRVLAWMSGQTDLIEQYARGDDVYKRMAEVIFNTLYERVTGDQRFVGKQSVLGCGYGMGGPKFHATCLAYGRDIGMPLAKKTVMTYRSTNKMIVRMWYGVQEAAVKAIKYKGRAFKSHMCTFKHQGDYLYIKLPSGRCISYYKAKIKMTDFGENIEYYGWVSTINRLDWIDTYGGKLVENIVQAVARDLLIHGMLLVQDNGYDLLVNVHDELVSERDKGTGDLGEYEALMASLPDWAVGCPVEAEGWVGMRYKK